MNQKLKTESAVISTQDLSKVFHDFWHRPKVRAVDDLTLKVMPGEVFGLLGPNGSGKSTTLKMILGLLYPTGGSLEVFGHSPRDVKTKGRIGYLPEESYLYSYLTAEETLKFYGSLYNLKRNTCRERIEELLEMIGLKHARHRPVGEFSKGMARRIGLAQTLINDPDLVILDEPTSGLDPIGCKQVKDLILELGHRGKTVLLSSHLLADVEDVCDRIAILYNGRIQAMGPIDDLLEEKNRYRLTLKEVTSDQLKTIMAEVRRLLGNEPDIEHPRRDLEQFFLDVVRQARRDAPELSGADFGKQLASFLSTHPGASSETGHEPPDPSDSP